MTGNHRGNVLNDEGRTCSHCKEFKQWDFFNKNKLLPYGKANICKPCAAEAGRKFRAKADITYLENDLSKKREYYQENKSKLDSLNLQKYYKRHYGIEPDEVIRKKEEGCEICGSHFRVQFDKEWKDGSIHVICNTCRATANKYDEPVYSLQLLRSFTLTQAIRKGLH